MSPRPPHALTPRRIREVAEVFFSRTMSDAICPRCRVRYLPIGGSCICGEPFKPSAIAERAARALAGRKPRP